MSLIMKKFGFGSKNMEQTKRITDSDKLIQGAQLAIKKIIEKAKRDDRTLVIERDGKIVHVRARDL